MSSAIKRLLRLVHIDMLKLLIQSRWLTKCTNIVLTFLATPSTLSTRQSFPAQITDKRIVDISHVRRSEKQLMSHSAALWWIVVWLVIVRAVVADAHLAGRTVISSFRKRMRRVAQ